MGLEHGPLVPTLPSCPSQPQRVQVPGSSPGPRGLVLGGMHRALYRRPGMASAARRKFLLFLISAFLAVPEADRVWDKF